MDNVGDFLLTLIDRTKWFHQVGLEAIISLKVPNNPCPVSSNFFTSTPSNILTYYR